jgi:hypothetical protein
MSQQSPVRLVKKDGRAKPKCDSISDEQALLDALNNIRAAHINLARQAEIIHGIMQTRLIKESGLNVTKVS